MLERMKSRLMSATMKQKTIALCILLILGLLMVALPLSLVIYGGPTSTPTTFHTAELAINPVEVNPGVEVTITAQVTNTGDTEGSYTAELRIDDVAVATTKVTMAAGASQPVNFVEAMATPGTYEVTWIEIIGETEVPRLTGEFVVVETDETITLFPTPAPYFIGVDVVTSKTDLT